MFEVTQAQNLTLVVDDSGAGATLFEIPWKSGESRSREKIYICVCGGGKSFGESSRGEDTSALSSTEDTTLQGWKISVVLPDFSCCTNIHHLYFSFFLLVVKSQQHFHFFTTSQTTNLCHSGVHFWQSSRKIGEEKNFVKRKILRKFYDFWNVNFPHSAVNLFSSCSWT